jgi:perosamine synthetase
MAGAVFETRLMGYGGRGAVDEQTYSPDLHEQSDCRVAKLSKRYRRQGGVGMTEIALDQKIIPSARPYLDEADQQAMQRVIASGWIADGNEIASFESEFAAFVGRKESVALSSGFAALHLSLAALDIGPGDEVIIPCVSTCPAIRNAVLAVGANPVFADTNEFDFNLSPDSVSSKINPKTRAIIAPHHTGVPSDLKTLNSLGVPVIEDCAQSLGAKLGDRPLGSIGFASVFSFYATKMITTVDGGAVTSRSSAFLKRVRDLRYYRATTDRSLRYNYKLQNLHAALGRTQLVKLPYFVGRRRLIAGRYLQLLEALGYPPARSLHGRGTGAVYYRFGFRFPTALLERAIAELRTRRIPFGTEVEFLTDKDPVQYPNAVRLSEEILTFPTYPALEENEVEHVLDALRAAFPCLKGEMPDENCHPSA